MILRKAKKEDLTDIMCLYKSVLGTEGCAWNQYYPGNEELQRDLKAGCLYVLAEDSAIIGAISIAPENEFDGMDCWRIHDGTERELARLVVSPCHQGKGYARQILIEMFSELKASGCHGVHILVAKKNKAAIALYKSIGFDFLDEAFMYENDFYVCEKLLI